MMGPLLNQIRTWLKKRNSIVWRLLGFASAVVGLLCYAVSPSFNSQFGKWNRSKTILYCVSCFIVFTLLLLPKEKVRRCSSILKVHIAFSALTITSLYSFHFDKTVNNKDKPDPYALVSCVAFAVTSLSLASQTHWGFEVELMHFFIGALIVQFMKINQWLVLAGAGFGYSLIVLRSCIGDGDTKEANGNLGIEDRNRGVIDEGSLVSQSSDTHKDPAMITEEANDDNSLAKKD